MSCVWLTPKQAAEKAQVTKASIWRWIRDGRMVCYLTPGGAIRICEKDLILPFKGMKDFITGGKDGPTHRS